LNSGPAAFTRIRPQRGIAHVADVSKYTTGVNQKRPIPARPSRAPSAFAASAWAVSCPMPERRSATNATRMPPAPKSNGDAVRRTGTAATSPPRPTTAAAAAAGTVWSGRSRE